MKKAVIVVVLTAMVFALYAHRDVSEGSDGVATVRGVVLYSDTPPGDEVIRPDRDTAVCGTEQPSEKYLIKNGRVKNAVVWLEGVKAGKSLPKKDVVIEISGCRITPLVSVGFVGGNYRIINRDPILHTVQLKLGLSYHKEVSTRPLKEGATIYNLALPKQDMQITKPIRRFHRYTPKTGFIKITSNTHPWMRGFVFVFDHPYAAVTDSRGEFQFNGIPPGEYVLKVWHEGFGLKEFKIKLRATETRQIKVDLKTGQLSSAKQAYPSIKFVQTRYDFGTIRLKEAVSHDFEFVNQGQSVLRIIDLIPA